MQIPNFDPSKSFDFQQISKNEQIESKPLTPEEFVKQAISIVNDQKTEKFEISSSSIRQFFSEHKSELNIPQFIDDVIKIVQSEKNTFEETRVFVKELVERQCREGNLSTLNKLLTNYRNALWEFISEYGITDQTTKVEIAKISAARNAWGTSKFIKNFGISEEKGLFEIAKISAGHNGGATSAFLKNYGIQDEKELIEIALIAAAQDGSATSAHIENYNIKDEHARIEIARKAAVQSGGSMLVHIDKYNINNKEARIEIAKYIAALKGEELSDYIKLFDIDDEKELIEIAKIAAAQNGGGTSEHFQNYGIKDEKARLEIATIATAQDGFETSKFFHNYKIKDVSDSLRLFISAFQQNRASLRYIRNYNLDLHEALWKSNIMDLIKDGSHFETLWGNSSFKTVLEKLCADRKDRKNILSIIESLTKEIKSQYVKNEGKKNRESIAEEQLNWLKFTFSTLFLNTQNTVQLTENTWKEALSYRDPNMRYQLSKALAGMDEEQLKVYTHLTTNKSSKDFIVLPAIFISKMAKDEKKWKELFQKLQSSDFKDYKRLRPLMNALEKLEKNPLCNEEEYIAVLNAALKPTIKDDREVNLSTISAIVSLGGMEDLKKEAFEKHEMNLSKILKVHFRKQIPIKDLDNFDLKLSNTFSACRMPESLYIYAGRLKNHIQKEKALSALGTYVEWVLNDQFKSERYEKSSHLELIFKDNVEFKKNWIKGASEVFNIEIKGEKNEKSETRTYTISDSDDFWDLFLCGTEVEGSCQRVNGNPNHNIGLLGYLLDGKHRIAEIKDADGKIVARRILRLLWDKSNNKPVLLMEWLYPDILNPELKLALDIFVKKRAKELGVDLYEQGENPVELESKDSRSPCEYVDSADGIQWKGIYKITKAKLVQASQQ